MRAYYIMTDISAFGFGDDVEFARYLVKDVGVAAVPGSSFYKNPPAAAPSCGSATASGTRRSPRRIEGWRSSCLRESAALELSTTAAGTLHH